MKKIAGLLISLLALTTLTGCDLNGEHISGDPSKPQEQEGEGQGSGEGQGYDGEGEGQGGGESHGGDEGSGGEGSGGGTVDTYNIVSMLKN